MNITESANPTKSDPSGKSAAHFSRHALEPGLLPLFRLLTGVRLVLGLLSTLRLTMRGGSLIFVLLSLSDGLLLLGYLSWPWLRQRLGRAFLPIGLIMAAAGPLLVQYAWIFFLEGSGMAFLLNAWQLLPTLLIPVVLAAWQYGFRASLAVVLGSMALDTLLTPLAIATSRSLPALVVSNQELGISVQPVLVWGMVGVLVGRNLTALVVGYMVSRLMQAQREQRAALAEANARLVGYAAALEQLTTSRERNRLARELHDTLAHSLSAMAVQLEAADALWETAPDEARRRLARSLETTRSGLAETRRALQALRASPLEDLGLSLALRGLAESAAARTRLAVDVQAPETIAKLSPAVEQCIYRVAQEALENVSRHAHAQRVRVGLEAQGSRVVLTVADDGQGFDVAAALAEDRFGLRGMRERAEVVGGALEVTSATGEGTIVRLTVEVAA